MTLSLELLILIGTQLLSIGIFVGKINTLQKLTEFRFQQLEKRQELFYEVQSQATRAEELGKAAHKRLDTLTIDVQHLQGAALNGNGN